MNNKTINAGIKEGSNNYINNGKPMEELKFDSDTGNITCYADIKKHNEETQKQLDKAENTNFWLTWIAILIGLCLIVAGI